MTKRRPQDRAIDAWWPAAGAVAIGWVLIWPLLWFLSKVAAWQDGFPYSTGISAMACWFVAVLCGFSAWDLWQLLRGQPGVELAEPGMKRLRRWWVAPAILVLGMALGWAVWK